MSIKGKVSHNFSAMMVAKAYEKESQHLVNDVSSAVQVLLKKMLSRGDGRKNPSTSPNPPHVRTGTLLRSWTTKNKQRARRTDSGHSLLLGSNVVYARALEYGYAPRNLDPRPYLGPTVRSGRLKMYIRKRLNQSAMNIRGMIRKKVIKK